MKTPLVYILAASHSGSTLLARLLARHSQLCTVGELKATNLGDVRRYRCSCHELLITCPFWTAITADLRRCGIPFSIDQAGTDFASEATPYVRRLLRPLYRGAVLEAVRSAALALSPTWRHRFPLIQARNALLVACVCRRLGKPIIVDSSKIAIRLKYLSRNPGLEVRVIRLIRDGRAVALTHTDPGIFADAAAPAFRGGGMGVSSEHERQSFRDGAREWRRSNEEAAAIVHSLARSAWIEVRYEALCRDSQDILDHIFCFIGVAPENVVAIRERTPQHILGNGMRLDPDPAIRLDERWRHVLTKADLQVFDQVAGRLNQRLGYEA